LNSANQSTAGSKVSNRDLFLLSQFSDFLVDDSVSGLLESHQLVSFEVSQIGTSLLGGSGFGHIGTSVGFGHVGSSPCLFDSAGSCTPADLDFQVGQFDVLDVDFESATVAIIAQKSVQGDNVDNSHWFLVSFGEDNTAD